MQVKFRILFPHKNWANLCPRKPACEKVLIRSQKNRKKLLHISGYTQDRKPLKTPPQVTATDAVDDQCHPIPDWYKQLLASYFHLTVVDQFWMVLAT